MLEAPTPEKRLVMAVKRFLSVVASRIKRLLGGVLQLTLHDQLGDLSRQTQRLGSASVESSTYLAGELRALDERLSRIEDELANLRATLERSGADSPEPLAGDEVGSAPRTN
jgi:hypothetical protein